VPVSPQPLPPDFAATLAARRDRLTSLGSRVLFFETLESTNDVAMSLASTDAGEGSVVIADAQTAGRGRRGRTWFSPRGAGLYVSVVIVPGRSSGTRERATALTTLAAGVALAEAIESVTGLAPAIKWPNDLLVGRRKLAGILAEGVAHASPGGVRAVVLGYGINVCAAAYPAELADRVTALESELGRSIDRAELCAESLCTLAARYDDLLSGRFDAILDAWRSRAAGDRNAAVEWDTPTGVRTGVTAGVDDMGALLVRSGATLERIMAGDVRWTSLPAGR